MTFTSTATVTTKAPVTSTATAGRHNAESLNDVRSVIPESCYRRSNPKAAVALVQATVLYAIPMVGLAMTDQWWALLVLWPLAGLAVSGLFVLGHDASHGALFYSRRVNRAVARLCMAPSAHVEAAWDLGHNRVHHGYTTRQGFDFVWHPLTTEEYGVLGRLARARHRVEWSCLGSGAYFLRVVWWEKMWKFSAPGKRHSAIVRDKLALSVLMVVAVAGAAVLGAFDGGLISAIWMPIKLLVVPFLIFVQIIGWAVYIHHIAPEIRWWKRAEWSQFKGQMESTTVLRLPRIANRLWFHNIFVHVPHHVDTRIPFHQLPKAASAIDAAYPTTVRSARLSLFEYLRVTRACKLYDFEAGHWLKYS